MSRPFRAHDVWGGVPRAPPWAGMCRPCGAQEACWHAPVGRARNVGAVGGRRADRVVLSRRITTDLRVGPSADRMPSSTLAPLLLGRFVRLLENLVCAARRRRLAEQTKQHSDDQTGRPDGDRAPRKHEHQTVRWSWVQDWFVTIPQYIQRTPDQNHCHRYHTRHQDCTPQQRPIMGGQERRPRQKSYDYSQHQPTSRGRHDTSTHEVRGDRRHEQKLLEPCRTRQTRNQAVILVRVHRLRSARPTVPGR